MMIRPSSFAADQSTLISKPWDTRPKFVKPPILHRVPLPFTERPTNTAEYSANTALNYISRPTARHALPRNLHCDELFFVYICGLPSCAEGTGGA
jgi:hypothetical protein